MHFSNGSPVSDKKEKGREQSPKFLCQKNDGANIVSFTHTQKQEGKCDSISIQHARLYTDIRYSGTVLMTNKRTYLIFLL
jgi:hypothetical protein